MTWGAGAITAIAIMGLPTGALSAPSGALIAAVCANCHAPGPAEPGEIPSFSVLTGAEVAAALERFREGGVDATIMSRIAKGLTAADIAALAAHLDGTERTLP